MSYLLDTCVISEARRRTPEAVAWPLAVDPAELYLSVLSRGEIAKGIAIRTRTDPAAAASLERWLSGLRSTYADRILWIDDAVATEWGQLMASRTFPVADGLIAATARVHALSLVARNVADCRRWHRGGEPVGRIVAPPNPIGIRTGLLP